MSQRAAQTVCLWLVLLIAALGNAASAANCTKDDPGGKVGDIPLVEASSPSSSSCGVQWLKLDEPPDHFYLVECPRCQPGVVNVTNASLYTFDALESDTQYNTSVTAGSFGCQLSNPYHAVCKTRLASLQGSVHITSVTETSFTASWAPSPDAGVTYVVVCGATELRTNETTVECRGLQSGAAVTVAVKAVRSDYDEGQSHNIYGTGRTKLFAIDASSTQLSTTESSMTVSWDASKTAGVTYELTCSWSGGSRTVQTAGLTATCSSLESGQQFRVTVAVNKFGFNDAVTYLGTHLTKPLLIPDPANFNASLSVTGSSEAAAQVQLTVSWTPAAAEGADSMLAQVTSELNNSLSVSSSGAFNSSAVQLSERQFFSERLRVTVTALAEKSGLSELSQDIFVTTMLTPPNQPSVIAESDKRSIKATLKASSKSDKFYVGLVMKETGLNATLKCHASADPDSGCSVTFNSLKPYTDWQVESWAEFQSLNSQVTRVSTRTLEAPSGRVRNLTVTVGTSDTAMVEFEAPEMKNGLLLAYAVQVFGASSGDSLCSLMVLNVTSASCQLPQSECMSDKLIAALAKECNTSVRQVPGNLSDADTLIQLRLAQLQQDLDYTVRVTPISQTLAGLASDTTFSVPSGKSDNRWLVIVVSVVVSVVLLLLIAAVLAVILYRRRTVNSARDLRRHHPTEGTPAQTDRRVRPGTTETTLRKSVGVYAEIRLSPVLAAAEGQTANEAFVYDTVEEVKDEQMAQQFQSWSTEKLISRGTFREVFQVRINSGFRCAAKIFKLPVKPADRKLLAPKIDKLLESEQQLRQLKHDNIVRFLHITQSEPCTVVLFMELLDCRPLRDVIESKRLDETEIVAFSRQTCSALHYLHSHTPPVIHGDISSCSILIVAGSDRVKLTDFGLSAKLQSVASCSATSLQVSAHFMAPELLSQEKVEPSRASDIWAFGCVLFHMATGSLPFSSCINLLAIPELVKSRGAPELPAGGSSGELGDFYTQCVARAPGCRKSAGDLLRHRFLVARG